MTTGSYLPKLNENKDNKDKNKDKDKEQRPKYS